MLLFATLPFEAFVTLVLKYLMMMAATRTPQISPADAQANAAANALMQPLMDGAAKKSIAVAPLSPISPAASGSFSNPLCVRGVTWLQLLW